MHYCQKLAACLLAFILVPLVYGAVWAESFDTWYSVDRETPHFEANLEDAGGGIGSISLDYYLDDFTYLHLFSSSPNTIFEGCCLFDFGIYLGASCLNGSCSILSGYRCDLSEQGYIAAGLQYDLDSGVVTYDLDFTYYADNAKIQGHLYLDADPYLILKANVQTNEQLVVGGDLSGYLGSWDYSAGLTWMNDPFIADVKVIFSNSIDYYLSGVCKLNNNFKLGLGLNVIDANLTYEVKLGYEGKSNISLIFKNSLSPLGAIELDFRTDF